MWNILIPVTFALLLACTFTALLSVQNLVDRPFDS